MKKLPMNFKFTMEMEKALMEFAKYYDVSNLVEEM